MSVLKYSELPPTIKPEVVMRGPEPFPLFPVDQYLSGIGVDLSKIKAVHFHGGRRTARMAGSEVTRLSKLLNFAFTRTTEGNPYVVWPEVPFTVSTSVDMIKQVDVFVDKEPPTQDLRKRKWFYPDGSEVVGVAYGSEEKNIKATRIYADGKLLTVIRRKGLPEGVLLPGTEADPVYGLDVLIESIGIKRETIKTVDLLVGDESYVRLSPEAFAGSTFALPHKRQGKIDIQVERGARTVEGVTAIQIYQTAPLFDRDEKYFEAKPPPP